MAPLKVEQYVVGPVQTNCYFAINDDTKEVLVIDPGASADQLAKKICQEKLTPIAILLTHGHFDHATGAGELAHLAGFHIRVFHTPGHTVGGCCYYFPYQNVVFSGDTLFCTSVGRTDFPKGSAAQIIRSIKEKLLPLPDETTVYTGHNDITTIGTERMYNPYL